MEKEKNSPLQGTEELLEDNKELILFNDEVNTFDFVIRSLIEVCKHSTEQAEQCAMLAHFKGKCAVKSGTLIELKPFYTELSNRELTVTID